MKNKYIIITIVIIMSLIAFWLIFKNRGNGGLIVPKLMKQGTDGQSVDSTSVSTPDAPKTFKFNSSTDLKKELDSINPQVLDSDFK